MRCGCSRSGVRLCTLLLDSIPSPIVAPSTSYSAVYAETQPWRSPRKRKKVSCFLYHFWFLFFYPQEQNGLDRLCSQVPRQLVVLSTHPHHTRAHAALTPTHTRPVI